MNDVSVVLCTFNGDRYLPMLLDSFERQSAPIAEFILYDDGSTDGTIDLLKAFVEKARPGASRAKLMVNTGPPRGASQAFSHAVGFATGQYVAFADQDDVWHKDRLLSGLEALVAGGALLVGSDADVVDEFGVAIGSTVMDQFESKLMPRERMISDPLSCLVRQNYVPGMTMTADRASLSAWLPVPDGWMHDYWFALNAASTGTFKVLPESLVAYRQHGSNVLGVRRQLSLRRLVGAAVSRLRRRGSAAASTADWLSAPVAWMEADPLARKTIFERDRSLLSGAHGMRRLLFGFRRAGDYRELSHLGYLGILRDVVFGYH